MIDQQGQKPAPSPFWTFSLRLYGTAGVPPACIALQDAGGVDVNLLLFLLFCARAGRRLGAADVGKIVSTVDPWRNEVVVPLRTARRALREALAGFDAAGAAALRQKVKAVELEAERLQQEALYALFPIDASGSPARPMDAARANMASYAETLGVAFDAAAVETLLTAFETIKDQTS